MKCAKGSNSKLKFEANCKITKVCFASVDPNTEKSHPPTLQSSISSLRPMSVRHQHGGLKARLPAYPQAKALYLKAIRTGI